jgi:hypothetical protein
MIYFRILLSLGFIVLIGASAEAFYINQGIHGMKWGDSIADYHDLTKVHEKSWPFTIHRWPTASTVSSWSNCRPKPMARIHLKKRTLSNRSR